MIFLNISDITRTAQIAFVDNFNIFFIKLFLSGAGAFYARVVNFKSAFNCVRLLAFVSCFVCISVSRTYQEIGVVTFSPRNSSYTRDRYSDWIKVVLLGAKVCEPIYFHVLLYREEIR